MKYQVIQAGESSSFPDGHSLVAGAAEFGEVAVIVGANAGARFRELSDRERYTAVLIELRTECLGVHTGEARGTEGSNVLGFARFRLGDAPPSKLIELVRQPKSAEAAIAAARALFEGAGLQVAVCNDFAGRIVDRLVRPYYNAVLRRLDEGLATADDLDTTLKLGLGYPEGPIALLERTGLHHHYEVTQSLLEMYGDADYAPARRARVAWERKLKDRGSRTED